MRISDGLLALFGVVLCVSKVGKSSCMLICWRQGFTIRFIAQGQVEAA